MKMIFSYVIPLIMIFLGVYLAFFTEMLKDQSQVNKKPYSFARTQLLWWSLIIISLFSISYGDSGVIPTLSGSTLVLLGISLGTVAAARIIDNNDENNHLTRHQNDGDSKGFLIDILSDDNGISVHRFQSLLFNIIFGVIFIHQYFFTKEFINFESIELGLMGISSAAYVGLKLFENKKTNQTLTDDDLKDIDEDFTRKNNVEVG